MAACRARLAGAAVALLILGGCSTEPDRGADFGAACAARGLTPGSDAHVHCMERLRLQQNMDLERIRQAREVDRGSSRL
jgi:hypothetical protein